MLSILYVDDDPGLLELAKAFLEEPGQLEIETVGSPQAALALFGSRKFDAIISDYMMPDMNGIEFLKAIRASSNIPFILFTGKGREEVVIEALNRGADFYVKKGGDARSQFAELLNMVEQAVARREAEESVAYNLQYFRALIENSMDMIVVVDRDGKIRYISPSVKRVMGYDPEELLDSPLIKYVHPEQQDSVSKAFTTPISQGEAANYVQFRIKHKKGYWLELEAIGSPHRVRDEWLVIANVRDMTERKKMQKALEVREEEFRSTFDKSPVGAVMGALDGKFIRVNDAFCRIVGYSNDELRGMNQVDITHPDDVQESIDGVRKVVSGEAGQFRTEKRYVRKDGKIIWGRTCVSLIEGRSGEPARLLAIIEDITEHKIAEQDLIESEANLRALLEAAGDAIILHDVETGEPVEANAETLRRFKASSLQDLGTKLWNQPPHSLDDAMRLIRKAQEEGPQSFEWSTTLEDGTVVKEWVKLQKLSLRGVDRVLSISRDITELGRFDQTMQDMNRRLKLLSGITRHDLLNQLMILAGYLQLHKASLKDPGSLVHLAKVEHSIEVIRKQVQFTGDYEAVGTTLPKRQSIAKLIGAIPEGKEIKELVMTQKVKELAILADPMLPKVFGNLLLNSIQHGEKVTRVEIDCREVADGLILSYADDGIGISQEDKGHVFEKGFGKGTGLGMFLSKEILGMTGIKIMENGEPGKGARFEMLVPCGGYWLNGKDDNGGSPPA